MSSTKVGLRTINMQVPVHVHQAVKDLAQLNGRPMWQEASLMVEEYLSTHKERVAKAQGFLREWEKEQ